MVNPTLDEVNVNEDRPPPETFETLVSGYAAATEPSERRLFLRAALRRLEHDAEIHADHVRLLVVASAADGQA